MSGSSLMALANKVASPTSYSKNLIKIAPEDDVVN